MSIRSCDLSHFDHPRFHALRQDAVGVLDTLEKLSDLKEEALKELVIPPYSNQFEIVENLTQARLLQKVPNAILRLTAEFCETSHEVNDRRVDLVEQIRRVEYLRKWIFQSVNEAANKLKIFASEFTFNKRRWIYGPIAGGVLITGMSVILMYRSELSAKLGGGIFTLLFGSCLGCARIFVHRPAPPPPCDESIDEYTQEVCDAVYAEISDLEVARSFRQVVVPVDSEDMEILIEGRVSEGSRID